MGGVGRRVLAGLVLALALLSGVGGWLLFDSTSGSGPDPSSDRGYVTVLTDDPEAVVQLRQRVVLEAGHLEDVDHLLSLEVVIRRRAETPFSWAVVTGGGVGLPCASTGGCLVGDPAGDALPRGAQRSPSDTWIQGGVDSASYVRNANLTFATDDTGGPPPNANGSVYVGTARGSTVEFRVVGPTRGALWYRTGEFVRTQLPTLGVDRRYYTGAFADFARSERAKDIRVFVGDAGRDKTDAATVARVEEPDWALPATQTTEISLADGRPPASWRLTEFQPAPRAARDWTWSGSDNLEIDASVEDGDRARSNQRRQFIAGALIGVAGGFCVWCLELVVHELGRIRSERPR